MAKDSERDGEVVLGEAAATEPTPDDLAATVLDELGLGPSGPPIPPPAVCSVVHCPAKREVPAEVLQHFVLLPAAATGPEEEEAPESVVDVPTVPTVKTSEEQGTPARGHWRREKGSSSQEAVRGKQSSGCGRRDLQGPATGPPRRGHPAPPRELCQAQQLPLGSACPGPGGAAGPLQLRAAGQL
ncbi:hydrocephalus-inducing protein-like [Melanerpes formicivorus]|uniref:hydrocephalus-inducing protein-like n=1 Tax=Melanerpes formicivorus TaxID=211600 RepID=UPI00358E2C2D